MSEKVGEIYYDVTLETAQMIEGQRKVKRSLGELGDAGDKLQSKMNGVASAIAAMFAAGVIVNEFRKASEAAKLFERSIDNLSAITGATGSQLKILENAAKEFGRSTSASALQAAEAMKLIASAKPELLENAEALKQVTAQAVILADASGMSLPQAADSLTLALNQMGAGSDQAARFINVMAAGAKFGASEIAQSSDALKQFAVSAKGVGLSIEEANAGIQALAAFGIKGSEAGTALRNVLLKLETETDTKLKPSLNGLAGSLDNLSAKNLSTAELTKLFGLENINASNALMGSTEQIRLLTTQLTGTQTAIEQATTNTDNYEGSLRRMNNALAVAYTEMGAKFNPILKSGADLVTQLAVEISEGSERIETAISFISVAAVAAAGSLSGSLVVSLYTAIRAMSAATVAASAFSGVMSLMGGPIGIAITALALLALNWDKVTGATKDAAEMTEQAAQRIQNALSKTSMKAAADLSKQLSEVNREIADINKELEYKGPGQADKDQLKELRERLATLTQIRQEIERAAKTTGGGAGRGSVNPDVVTPRPSSGGNGGAGNGSTGPKFDAQAYLSGLRKAQASEIGAINETEAEKLRIAKRNLAEKKITETQYAEAVKLIQTAAEDDRVELMRKTQEKIDKDREESDKKEQDAIKKKKELQKEAIDYAATLTKAVNPIDALRQEYQAKLEIVTQYEQMMAQAGVDATAQGQLTRTQITNEYELQRRALAEQSYRSQGEAQAFLLDSLQSLSSTATSSIVGLLDGTTTAQGAMRALGQTITNEAIGALVQMGVQQIKNALISDSIKAADAAKSAAMGAVYAASVSAQVTGMAAMAAQNAFAATAAIPIIGPGLAPAAAAAAGTAAAALGAPAIATAPLAGARQYGGPVSSGSMYRVNETGAPEMFTANNGNQYMLPTKSGSVTSADKVGGGGVSVVVNVDAGGSSVQGSGEQSKQLGAMIGNAVRAVLIQEKRNGGLLS